ncbi:MAG: hypothetical protein H7334_09940, partial [Ferruginibacter sp.]|nr:hypothetical protein [Ferruginibacter sp.]
IFWQKNKNSLIKDSIKTTVKAKTDSLYSLRYDSSEIDEINGNANFYNVTLQSDSIIKKMLASTDSLPNAFFNISVQKVSITGVDMVGLFQKQKVTAQNILLYKPVIQITNTGVDRPKTYTYNDTLELYQRMLGKFKSINAKVIKVVQGAVLMADKNSKPLTTLENINITLNNFLIDSTRDYQNIISYFIKDVKATVENIQLPEAKNGTRINITKLLYDAPAKLLQVGAIQQYQPGNTTPILNIKNVQVNQLNTDAFIVQQKLKSGLVTCDGGLVTIYRQTKNKFAGSKAGAIEISSQIIDEAQIDGIQLGQTKIIVIDPSKPKEAAFIINDVTFTASQLVNVTSGSTVDELINNANWELTASGFSFLTKEKMYKFIATGIQINNKIGTVKIKQIALKPLYSEEKFIKIMNIQKDRYDLNFNNINLKGVNFKKLVNKGILEIEDASLQPVIKISNDRTMPAGKPTIALYPQQSIQAFKFPFYVKATHVINGGVFYTERGADSKMKGSPTFTQINANISNLTNLPDKIKANSILDMKASALFLDAAKLSTEWQLPLNPLDTVFKVKGEMGAINDATVLNKITEPLGMVSIKSGKINSLVFDLICDNNKGRGTSTLLYNDLKIQVLKVKNDELKKRGLLTFLANTLIKNDNPRNNNIYVSDIDIKRDIYSSFFSLLLQCILDGANKTVLRK